MAIKATASITLTYMIDIVSYVRYYILQSSSLNPPLKPVDNVDDPPGGNWVDTEPTYTSGSTNSLYYTDQTKFSDGSFIYSPVSLSSSYEAAKAAYNEAVIAGNLASKAAAKMGYCSTEIDMPLKVVSCSGFDYFDGALVTVLFSNGNSAVAMSLNVNNKGAKPVYFKGGTLSARNPFYFSANTSITFQYTHLSANDNGYWMPIFPQSIIRGTCSTAADVVAKTLNINNAILHVGVTAVIEFTNGNSVSNPTMNISSINAISIDTSINPIWASGQSISFTLEPNESYNSVYWRVNAESFRNNFYHDDEGAHVVSDVGGLNTLVTSNAIKFRNGSTVLASYTGTYISLGDVLINETGMHINHIAHFTEDLISLGYAGAVVNFNNDTFVIDTTESHPPYTDFIIRPGENCEYGPNIELTTNIPDDPDDDYASVNIVHSTVGLGGSHESFIALNAASILLNGNTYIGNTQISNTVTGQTGATGATGTTGDAEEEEEEQGDPVDPEAPVYTNTELSFSPAGDSNHLDVDFLTSTGFLKVNSINAIDPSGQALKAIGDKNGSDITTTYLKIANGGISDLNTATETGFYNYNSGASNKPSTSAGGNLLVIYNGGNYTHQIAEPFGSQDLYVRSKSTNTWSSWKRAGCIDAAPTWTAPTFTSNRATNLGGGFFTIGKMVYVQMLIKMAVGYTSGSTVDHSMIVNNTPSPLVTTAFTVTNRTSGVPISMHANYGEGGIRLSIIPSQCPLKKDDEIVITGQYIKA